METALQIHSALQTDKGRKRPHNEDFAGFFESDDLEELKVSGCLYIVADGVGGSARGERASQYAVQKVLYEYYRYPQIEPGERLRQVLRQAGNDIYEYAMQSGYPTRMATTMVAAALRGNTLTVANVGDSRAYLIRSGEVRQITRDHSMVGEMVRDGVLTEAESLRTKGKNRITRSLGGETDVQVDIFKDILLQPGDRILLCSDGLTRYALREDIARMTSNGTAEDVAQRLVDFANAQGGADNVSALLIDVGKEVSLAEVAESISRGHAPAPVDWETMATQVGLSVEPPIRRLLTDKKYLPFAIVGIALLFMIVIGSITAMFVQGSSSGEVSTETALLFENPQINPSLEIFSTRENGTLFESLPTTNPSEQQELDLPATGVTIEGGEATGISQSETPEPEDNNGIVVEPVSCIYTVQSGDSLSTLFDELEIEYDPNKVECLPENNGGCKYTPKDTDTLDIGWVLKFFDVNPTNCKEVGGKMENE